MTNLSSRPHHHARIGLIVNPVAGLGGRVGLKGSDGVEIQRRARELGAIPQALDRAADAMTRLHSIADRIELVTCPGPMGEAVAARCGIPSRSVRILGKADQGPTTAADTKTAAREMHRLGIDLLLFAGGDGTARDVYNAVGERQVVLGIPAGVKIHSGAYAIGSAVAGDLAAAFATGTWRRTREAEVLDADEDAIRHGVVCTTLCGVLRVPDDAIRLQGAKAVSGKIGIKAVARHLADEMNDKTIYIVAPGTTTRAVFDELGLDKTLLGVDVLRGRTLIASDVGEAQLLELLAREQSARIVVTPIGGQGYLFGRGNQPISPEVLRHVGCNNVIVIAAPEKLDRLTTRPLLVDTGDEAVDQSLAGYVRVCCGVDDVRVVRVAAVRDIHRELEGADTR